jgi:MFS transporter, YNFM family, putative membrane transport protein
VDQIRVGSPPFWRANLALFLGGLVTFAALYNTQPPLPSFAAEFRVSPATASLSVSATTAALAISLLIAGTLSETLGRKSVMIVSLVMSSVLTLATAWSPDFATLLVLRAILGVCLAGLPAVAMTYLGEEVQPAGLGLAVGIYIGGNSIGGLSGRIVTALLTDAFSWRTALATVGGLSLLASLAFSIVLPASRHFHPRALGGPRTLFSPLMGHLRDPALLRLYLTGFLVMCAFVALYNYVSFDLEGPPYYLSESAVGWIFLTYLLGSASSAWLGRLADRWGRRKVLWIGIIVQAAGAVVTVGVALALKILGIAVFTIGFFGAHAVASGWVARRATSFRGQASSLYLLLYYVGASAAGPLGGALWTLFGWLGVVSLDLALLAMALALSLQLTRIPPIAAVEPAPSV